MTLTKENNCKEVITVDSFGYMTINGILHCSCKCGCISDKPILMGLCNDCCNKTHVGMRMEKCN